MAVQVNSSGLCLCGCGQTTNVSKQDRRSIGWIKGQPLRYLKGHHTRKAPFPYIKRGTGFSSPCWSWQWKLTPDGYGQIERDGRLQRAHRYYYEKKFGVVPKGKELDHLCEVRFCVNPDHLEPVSPAVNVYRSKAAKLNPELVKQVKAVYDAGLHSQKSVGKQFGISQSQVCRIVNGTAWREI